MFIALIIIGLLLIVGGIWLTVITQKLPAILISVTGLIAIIIANSIVFVPTGYVGIRTAYGQISEKPVTKGMNLKSPAEKIYLVNCKQQEVNLKDLQIWSETSERTEVYCQNVVVSYQINAEYATWIWSNVEEWDTNLVKQTTIESGVKAATKRFDDIEVTDRSKIEPAAKELVQKALNDKYNEQIVNVVSVTIGNMNFSDAYNEAIEKKAQAKLAAEAAEYQNKEAKIRAEAEAEQKKIAAQGDAEAAKIAAQGKAEAKKIESDAEAEANRKIAESLTPEIIEYKKTNKWNGQLPTYLGDANILLGEEKKTDE